MTWIGLVLVLLIFLTLLIAVPVGVLALAASPELRRTTGTLAARVAPVGLAGVVLAMLWMPTLDVVQQMPPRPPEQMDRAQAGPGPQSRESEFAAAGENVPDGRPIRHPTPTMAAPLPTAPLMIARPLFIVALLGLGVLTGVLSPPWRRLILAGAICAVVCGGVAALYFARHAPYAESAHAASIAEQQQIDRLLADRAVHGGAIPVAAIASTTAAPDVGVSPVAITSFTGDADPGRTVESLPDWVQHWSMTDAGGDIQQFVLTSRRYSSVDEAEQELLATLRPRLENYLQQTGLPVSAAGVTVGDLRRATAVLGRVHEQFLVDLGSTQEPVYRVTWQVALRPDVRNTLAADFRLSRRDARVRQLGWGLALATLVFGAWAAYFRIDDQTQGRYRVRLKLAAVATTVAGAAVTLLG